MGGSVRGRQDSAGRRGFKGGRGTRKGTSRGACVWHSSPQGNGQTSKLRPPGGKEQASALRPQEHRANLVDAQPPSLGRVSAAHCQRRACPCCSRRPLSNSSVASAGTTRACAPVGPSFVGPGRRRRVLAGWGCRSSEGHPWGLLLPCGIPRWRRYVQSRRNPGGGGGGGGCPLGIGGFGPDRRHPGRFFVLRLLRHPGFCSFPGLLCCPRLVRSSGLARGPGLLGHPGLAVSGR